MPELDPEVWASLRLPLHPGSAWRNRHLHKVNHLTHPRWLSQDKMNQLLEEGISRRCLLRWLTRPLRLGWSTPPKHIVQNQTHKTSGGAGESCFSPAHDTPQSKKMPKPPECWSLSCTALWPSPGHTSHAWQPPFLSKESSCPLEAASSQRYQWLQRELLMKTSSHLCISNFRQPCVKVLALWYQVTVTSFHLPLKIPQIV